MDARRNREVILRVADEAFGESDEVALDEVARRAGLGRATVYRHFPDRRALGLAVATERLAWLERLADRLDPGACQFRELLLAALTAQVTRRPLVRLFTRLPARYQHQYSAALIAVLEPAFRRAQAEGRVRPDVDVSDLVLIFEMIEAALSGGFPGTHHAESTRRLIPVIVDGLYVVASA